MADKKKGFTVIHNFLKELESRDVKYPKNGHIKGAEGKNLARQWNALKKYPLKVLKKLKKGKKTVHYPYTEVGMKRYKKDKEKKRKVYKV